MIFDSLQAFAFENSFIIRCFCENAAELTFQTTSILVAMILDPFFSTFNVRDPFSETLNIHGPLFHQQKRTLKNVKK